VDLYTNSAISVAQWNLLAIALYRIIFRPYICSYLVSNLIPQVGSYPAPLQRWVSLQKILVYVCLSFSSPFVPFVVIGTFSDLHKGKEKKWHEEWSHVSVTMLNFAPQDTAVLGYWHTERGISCRWERRHDQQHADGSSQANRFALLTFWRRNYFFLILAHPVYKMWII